MIYDFENLQVCQNINIYATLWNIFDTINNYYYVLLISFIIIYNYLTRKLREFYFTKGSQDQFCLPNIQSARRDIFYAKLVERTRGLVNFLISRKSSCK